MSSYNTHTETDSDSSDRLDTAYSSEWPSADAHAVVGGPVVDDVDVDQDEWEAALQRMDDRDERSVRALTDLRQHHLGDYEREAGPIPITDGGQREYLCRRCDWLGDECARDDHYPVCPSCGRIVDVLEAHR